MVFLLEAWGLPNSCLWVISERILKVYRDLGTSMFWGTCERWGRKDGAVENYLVVSNLESQILFVPANYSEQFGINQMSAEVPWPLRYRWSWFWSHSKFSRKSESFPFSLGILGGGGLHFCRSFLPVSLCFWVTQFRACCCSHMLSCSRMHHLSCSSLCICFITFSLHPHQKASSWCWVCWRFGR